MGDVVTLVLEPAPEEEERGSGQLTSSESLRLQGIRVRRRRTDRPAALRARLAFPHVVATAGLSASCRLEPSCGVGRHSQVEHTRTLPVPPPAGPDQTRKGERVRANRGGLMRGDSGSAMQAVAWARVLLLIFFF